MGGLAQGQNVSVEVGQLQTTVDELQQDNEALRGELAAFDP